MKAGRTWKFVIPAVVSGWMMSGCASLTESELRQQQEVVREEHYAEPRADKTAWARDGLRSLDDYIQYAFRSNPGLRAAFDRWKAAVEEIPQARSLPDPSLSFAYFIDQVDTRYQLRLTQVFPAFGKRSLRGDAAAAEARRALYAFEAERLRLIERVSKAFHDYSYLAQATRVMAESVRLVADLEMVVQARYQEGAVPFSDWIQTQVEKERLMDRLAALEEQRIAQSAALASLLNLPVDEPLPWPLAEPSVPVKIDEATLDRLLAERNPELKAAEATVEAAQYREKLARRSGWPDFMLGADWMAMQGMGGGEQTDVGLMAGISLPIWRGRTRAQRREAAALLDAAAHQRDDLLNRFQAELRTAVFRLRDAERQTTLFRDSLIPKAEKALAVSDQAYADGSVEFMALIDAHRTLLEFQLQAERAASNREIALAELLFLIGADRDEWPGKEDHKVHKKIGG